MQLPGGPRLRKIGDNRLRSRFEGGLVVEMQSPDRALREKLYARYLAATEHEAGG